MQQRQKMMNLEKVVHLFSWSVISMLSFPLLRVTSHPLDCVLDGGHRQIWQRPLVTVEQRLPAREDPHQRLAEKHKHSKTNTLEILKGKHTWG